MNELKALEHPTLKVPYEVFNKKYRQAQRTFDMESRQITAAASEIEQQLNKERLQAGEISHLLGGMVDKLVSMKRKASEAISEEVSAGCVCKRRLDHLKEHASVLEDPNALQTTLNEWRRVRLDRMVIEYFLRHGYYDVANVLANNTGLRELTNVDIYGPAAEVERELQQHQTARCLQWCADNKTKLRKLNSNMEFKIRIQEFVELIRSDQRIDAVKYARRHFSSFEEGQLAEIQQCMGALAFPKDTKVEPYASLLCPGRWAALVLQFRWEHARLLHPAVRSTLEAALHVGLAALKTTQCYTAGGRSWSCPVCATPLNTLASCLPHAHCSQSRLVCRISSQPMNENNQPMMLPNGQVYGEKALREMVKEHGTITCPKTKDVFSFKSVEKVFVM